MTVIQKARRLPLRELRFFFFGTAVLGLCIAGWSSSAEERRPLLMAGKKTLYQRVISRPAAQLHRLSPGSSGQPVPPFSIFYVYDRRNISGADWVEVGAGTQPPMAGWIPAAQTLEWKQSLTVAFTNPSGRGKVLFFRDRRGLDDVLKAQDQAGKATELLSKAEEPNFAPESPLIALEPDNYIDIRKQFYLLPIFGFNDAEDGSGNAMRALEIASMPILNKKTQPERDPLKDFSAGLVFVVDTTLSMDPYIDRTRDAIKRIYDSIRGTELGEHFRFGMVGFRSSTQAVPQLEYITRVFHKLNPKEQPDVFISAIADITASKISSARLDEDSLAGVKAALEDNDWANFGGRYIVLITDAGGLAANDPLSSTHLGANEIWHIAQEPTKQVAIFVLHLLTPEGKKDHAYAAAQYKQLARWPNSNPLYYPIPGGSLEAFGSAVDVLIHALIEKVAVSVGESFRSATPNLRHDPNDRQIERQVEVVGNAMRLAYLGRQEGTSAPDVIRAWTVDRDLWRPEIASLNVRVLLTKNQLSDLSDALRLILDQGYSTRLSPQDFFNQLRVAAATASRDPRQLGRINSIRDMLGEYLDGLPYKSQILEMTEDQWLAMGAASQQEVLDTIEGKLHLYQEFSSHPEIWKDFTNGRVPGDAIFPVPLEVLP